MKWGLDSMAAPVGELEQFFAMGWDWFAGYVGGKAAHVWTPEEWSRTASAGFALLPIWVAPLVDDAGREAGVEDGNACLDALGAAQLSGVVALDVENGLTPVQYASGFVDAVHAGSCRVVLYGVATTLLTLEDAGFDAWWLANWPGSGRPVTGAPPDFTLWQYAEGPQCDFNVCVDDFEFATLAATEEPEAPVGPPTAS